MKLLTSESMQKWEKKLVESYQIPTQLLMENAGRNVADQVSRLGKNKSWSQVSVVCGTGNNGGDGLVAARRLSFCFPFHPLSIYLVGNPENLNNDSRLNYEICQRLGLSIHLVSPGYPPHFEKG